MIIGKDWGKVGERAQGKGHAGSFDLPWERNGAGRACARDAFLMEGTGVTCRGQKGMRAELRGVEGRRIEDSGTFGAKPPPEHLELTTIESMKIGAGTPRGGGRWGRKRRIVGEGRMHVTTGRAMCGERRGERGLSSEG